MENYIPKYVIIKNYIIDKINSGDLVVGDRVPSENELSKQFDVSRVTANAAIKELFNQGIVERIQGKGTFVKEKKTFEENLYYEMDRSIKINSEFLETRHHLLEGVSLISPDEHVRNKFGLSKLDKVYKITRLMIREEDVVAIDHSYLPEKYVVEKDVNFDRLSSTYFHEFLASICEVELKFICIHIDAMLPSKEELEKMDVDKNYPLVVLDTKVLGSSDNLIAFTTTIADPKKYRAVANFTL